MSRSTEAREGRYLTGDLESRGRSFGAIKETAFFIRYVETIA